jgi:hypothetical protein
MALLIGQSLRHCQPVRTNPSFWMAQYRVEGMFRGIFYSGPSLERALEALGHEITLCRNEYHGPTDARLYCEGVAIETAMTKSGAVQVAPIRPKVAHEPSERMAPKWAKH